MKGNLFTSVKGFLLLVIFLLPAMFPSAMAQRPTFTTTGKDKAPSSAVGDTTSVDSIGSLAEQGIVYNHDELSNEKASAQVNIFHPVPLAVWINTFAHPPATPYGAHHVDPLDAAESLFLSRGYGQVHYSPLWRPQDELCFRYQPDPYPAYSHTIGTLPLYQARTPYTRLAFGSSLHNDYRLQATHTQNIKPRWNVLLSGEFIKRDGVYTRSGINDRLYDITTNYYSRDARYQLQAGVIRQSLEQQENGGVSDDTLCWGQSTRSGVPVNLYNAASRWRSTTAFVHQSFNTVRQLDSLGKPRLLNTGVIGLDLLFDKHKRNFFDADPSQFAYFFYDTLSTRDSSALYTLTSRLYWTNDAFPSSRGRNPFVVTLGMRPEVAWFHVDAVLNRVASVSSFAKGSLSLGHSTLTLQGEVVSGSYRGGDGYASLSWGMPLGRRMSIAAEAEAQRQSPALIYYKFSGNHARWSYDEDYYAKQGNKSLNLSLNLVRDTSGAPMLSISARASQLDNIILHTSNPLNPFVQHPDDALLLQVSLKANLAWRWLHLDLLQLLQHTNRDDLLHVPFYASKNSLYADFSLFHGAMRVQAGIDARYFTAFAADEWNAYYGVFLPQGEVKIGNYPWADFFLNAQIKRATLYVKVAHFNAPLTANPHYFTLPHYPGEDFGVYYGIVWQFYN